MPRDLHGQDSRQAQGLELESGVDGLAERDVGGEPWCAVVAPDHPLAVRRRVRVAGYEWLTWPRSSHPGHWHAVHAWRRRWAGYRRSTRPG
ncbi:hypothetical protein KN815_29235 [Streptomyces sp. 4503]|uniref:LysR substrate-binding domain-containing protein n=1 Tax=Streptomyces niphimycinicus TaxID=2842201 RepID=A0ABS6CM55_9ACTN|nr:LysR substrate-binding domain-containing protein [Streptomyces niphimycinicus]MBU3867995.1 hypothetical protein [Streptomyces niphimycinicus]